MTLSTYFWDLNAGALKEAKRALKDPRHPQFPQRMVTLLSRCDKPKELFSILPKGEFIEAWPKIQAYWMKRERYSHERDWWENIYEQLVETEAQKSGVRKGEPSAFCQTFGRTLKERRIELGLNQKQLALRTGLQQPLISQIEDGKKNITLFTLIRLCKVLGITTIDIS